MMSAYKPDELDIYRLKKAETDRERVQVLEEAVAKAVEKAQMNYLLDINIFNLVQMKNHLKQRQQD